MEIMTHVLTFGSLAKKRGEIPGQPIPCKLSGRTSIPRLLNRLRIGLHQVQLVMVNHIAVPRDYVIQPGDRVALFPPDYPIFADWKDFRFPVSNPSAGENDRE